MILVWVLIFFGAVLMVGSMLTAYWLAALSCAMHSTGCDQSGTTLFFDLLISPVGIVFWATLALGLFMVWWGYRVKTHHLKQRYRTSEYGL